MIEGMDEQEVYIKDNTCIIIAAGSSKLLVVRKNGVIVISFLL